MKVTYDLMLLNYCTMKYVKVWVKSEIVYFVAC